jgi:hypothetical protein
MEDCPSLGKRGVGVSFLPSTHPPSPFSWEEKGRKKGLFILKGAKNISPVHA